MFLFFFFDFSLSNIGHFQRSLPKYYLLEEAEDPEKTQIYNYFSFQQINNETVRDQFINIKRNLKNGTDIEANYNLLKDFADKGEYREAYFFLAMIHHLGLYNFDINDTLARSYLEIGASKYDQASISYLAIFCRFGIGGPENIPRSITLDFSDNLYGRLALGFYFRFGFYLPSSCSSAFQRLIYVSERSLPGMKRFETEDKYSEYFDRKKLPEQSEKKDKGVFEVTKEKALDGSVLDAFLLGVYYYRGMVPGGRPDYDLAMKCFNYTLKHGIAESYGFIGQMIFNGYGSIPEDKEKALEYIEAGAREGDMNSINMLGIFHLTNMIKSANKSIGLKYLTIAAMRGHIQSQMMLGIMTLSGEDPMKYDVKKGYQYIKTSSKNKMPQARLLHAYFKFHGIGTKRNCRSALKRIYRFLPDFPVFRSNLKKAYYAMANGDYEYSLRMNTHMAHWGSKNAAHSGLIAADFLKKNATKLIEILAAFGDGEAIMRILGENSENNNGSGDNATEKVLNKTELLLEAAKSNAEAAFMASWIYKNNMTLALNYLDITEKLGDRTKLLVIITKSALYVRALFRMLFYGDQQNNDVLKDFLKSLKNYVIAVFIYIFTLVILRSVMKGMMKTNI